MSSTPRKAPERFTDEQKAYILAHYGTEMTIQQIANHLYGTDENPVAAPEFLERLRRAASNFRMRGLKIGAYPEHKPHPIGFIRTKPNGCRQQKTEKGWVTILTRRAPRKKEEIERMKKQPRERVKRSLPSKRTAPTQKVARSTAAGAKNTVSEPLPYRMKGKIVKTEKKYSHDENPANMKIRAPKVPMKLVRVDKKTQIEVPQTMSDEEAIERYYAKVKNIQR